MQKQLSLKFLIVFVVALVVYIPVSMVKYKVLERSQYQQNAKFSVEESWTGGQRIITPILVVPYTVKTRTKNGFVLDPGASATNKSLVFTPEKIDVDIQVATRYLNKGIYRIPVYNSDIRMKGKFLSAQQREKIQKVANAAEFDAFGIPYLSIHVRDARGLEQEPTMKLNTADVAFNLGSGLADLPSGLHAEVPRALDTKNNIAFDTRFSLKGTETISVVPAADYVSVTMDSSWPHPEFTGAQLPATREVRADGFKAAWSTSKYARANGLLEMCVRGKSCGNLLSTGFGVKFLEPIDVYLQSERAVKYAILFIGLSFITFFIFEHIKPIRIHPVQYTFVGLAIAVFYLLLISLSEHVSFGVAYLVSMICCAGLLLFYVRYILLSIRSALLFFLMVLTLYGALFVIIQAEDFAFLMGALLVFLILTVLMIVTRNIDWYRISDRK